MKATTAVRRGTLSGTRALQLRNAREARGAGAEARKKALVHTGGDTILLNEGEE